MPSASGGLLRAHFYFMADNLSLLFKIRADAADVKKGTAESKTAVNQLRQSFGTDLAQSIGTVDKSFGGLASNLNLFVSQRIPLLGNAFQSLTQSLDDTASEATSIAASLGTVGTVAVGAAAGVIALTVGVAALGKQIFETTKQTAEFEGKFFDLSQQVGVSVETLSTLDNIAATTGGNIDTVTASLGLFQRNLEAAHDPTSKEAKLLIELGVTSLNTEVALRQTLKGLFDLGTGSRQTSAALELFGRSGRFVLAILKESHGNLDVAREKFAALGLEVSTGAAIAADQFNDNLEILTRQLAAVTRFLTSDTIPVFTVFFEDLNQFLAKNRNDWSLWSEVIKVETAGALAAFETLVAFIASRGTLDPLSFFQIKLEGLLQQANELKTRNVAQSIAEQALALATASGRPGDRPDAAKAASEAQQRAQKSIQLAQQRLEALTRNNREALERERDLDLKTIEEYVTEAKNLAEEHYRGQLELLDREGALARKFIKNREDLALALTDIEQKRTKATEENARQRQTIEDEGLKHRDRLELELNKQLAAIRDDARKEELRRIDADAAAQRISEFEAITRRLALLADAQDQRLLLIATELAQDTTSAERKIALDNERILSEQEYTNEKKRLTQERMDAFLRENEFARKAPGASGVPQPSGNVLTPDQLKSLGLPPLGDATDAFSGLGDALGDIMGLGREAGVIFGDVLAGAFENLAQGVGQAVQSFVLFGKVEGGFKKFAAEMIAQIAAMAAVQAVYQLAQGLAWLALNFFFPNPAYAKAAATAFASAAVFGSIAAVAAGAGRLVAGNSFSDKSGAGGGGGGTNGGGGQSVDNRDRDPLQIQAGRRTVEHVIRIETVPGFIARETVKEIDNNHTDLVERIKKASGR
jgi:hypothetical protein